MKKSTKIVVGSVVAAVGIAAIVCTTVEPVKNAIKNLLPGSETKKNTERQEATHEDEHYKTLTEEEKQEFDNKLEAIFEHDDYKNLSDDEKNNLVEKFVQSEKLQTEIKKEREEEKARLENANSQLESLADQSQQLEEQIQELKDAGATEDEISKIEQKQQELEDQIKSVEQEKAYFETVDTVKDTFSNFSISNEENTDIIIQEIHGIYKYGVDILVDADVLKSEKVGDVEIYTTSNCLYKISTTLFKEKDYEYILSLMTKPEFLEFVRTCNNRNAESHKEFFEQNKYLMHKSFQKLESLGASFEIVDSWEKEGDSEHPEYIVKCQQEGYEDLLFIISYSNFDYATQSIQKICPEFWAQLEVEQEKDAQSQSDSQASQNSAEESATSQSTTTPSKYEKLDTNGNLIGFDYASFQQDQAR